MNDYSNDCTILVNSCDAFSDVWDLFFTALKIQWADCKYQIILNTETKKYANDIVSGVINFAPRNHKDCWGRRYKNVLQSINTPYVMPLLEDFVLEEKFEGQKMIENAIKWMNKNEDIGVFYIHRHPYAIQQETAYHGFGLLPQKCEYKLTTAPGIWRKSYLDKCIKGIESPWEWELYASRRAWKYKEKEYALLQYENEPYKYPFGGVIWRGLWHTEAEHIADKYDVDIDFSVRGVMDENDPFRLGNVYSVVEHFPKDILEKRYREEVYKRVYSKWRKYICSI